MHNNQSKLITINNYISHRYSTTFKEMIHQGRVKQNEWWVTVDPTTEVDVRFPHERHGLAGIPSNHAKTAVREAFIDFIDNKPNGRSEDSSGPTFYFSPKFDSIQTNVAHYEERLGRLVVGEFNRYQRESGKGECSNGSSHNWIQSYRPKVAICPHQEDYCDNC